MLEHKRHVRKPPQLLEQRRIVESAKTGPYFVQVRGEFCTQNDILCVRAFDRGAEFSEAFSDQIAGAEIALRAANKIDRIEMRGELFSVDRADQSDVRVGRIGRRPRHGFKRKKRPRRFDLIDDAARGLDNQIESFIGQVVRVRAGPCSFPDWEAAGLKWSEDL